MPPLNDVPPPPYSETDIYSQPERTSPNPLTSPNSQHGDDAFSTTTSGDNVVYTPPETPRSQAANLATMGSTQTRTPMPQDANPTVLAYFGTRPTPFVTPPPNMTCHLTLKSGTTADDLSASRLEDMGAWLGPRGIEEMDWQTFVNFLLPDHDIRSNEEVAERKLRTEGSEAGRVMLESIRGSDNGRSNSDMSEKSAMSEERKEEIEKMTATWNAGFFEPRGVKVMVTTEDSNAGRGRTLGSHDQNFDAAGSSNPGQAGAPSAQQTQSQSRDAAQGQQEQPERSMSWNFGGVKVSIGGNLIDENGNLRWGPFIANQSSLRFNNTNLLNFRPGWGPTRGDPRTFSGFGPSPGLPHAVPIGGPLRGERGRDPELHPSRSRSHSVSSTSSSATSDSESSLGSLPDYDDLFGSQLDIFKSTLAGWVSSPNVQVNREDVRALRARLRAAKCQSKAQNLDRKEIKRELKPMLKQFRQMQKEQRKRRKEERKNRRRQRREEKREQRGKRREMRKAERDMRKVDRDMRRNERRGFGGGNVYGFRGGPPRILAVPGVSPVTVPAPPVPPAPLAPTIVPGMPQIPQIPQMPWSRGCPSSRGCGFPPRPGGSFAWGRNSFWGDNRGITFPGAWPESPEDGSSPHALDLKRRFAQFKIQMDQKNQQIQKIIQDMAKMEEKNRTKRCGGAAGNSMTAWAMERYETQKLSLEKEIEELQKKMEGVQIQADEEYAKEVAARENERR